MTISGSIYCVYHIYTDSNSPIIYMYIFQRFVMEASEALLELGVDVSMMGKTDKLSFLGVKGRTDLALTEHQPFGTPGGCCPAVMQVKGKSL